MNLIFTMNNRVYFWNMLWAVKIILLLTPCVNCAVNISEVNTTETAYSNTTTTSTPTTTTTTSPNTTTAIESTTSVINTSTATTSPNTTTIIESTTSVINNSTGTTSNTTTIKESTSLVLNTSTITTSPGTSSAATVRVPLQRPQQTLYQCQCDSEEVMNPTGQCQLLEDGTTVPTEPPYGSEQQEPYFKSTTYFKVKINEPNCSYHQVDLQAGEFMLRNRGDLLVFKGKFRGFRVAEYCIHHKLVEGKVEVTARGCVPQPVIPLCCEKGEYMNNGECVNGTNISEPFKPYLATVPPFGDKGLAGVPFPWNDHQNRIERVNCEPGKIIKKFELDGEKAYLTGKKTYLAVTPTKVLLSFLSDNGQQQYSVPPKYCVDSQENNNKYQAHSCEWNPEVYCKDKLCINKCCPEGQALSLAMRGCVPNNTTFTPQNINSDRPQETLYGWPKCQPITNINDFTIAQDGSLIHRDITYLHSEFCVDNFIMGDSVEPGGLACTKDIQETTWHYVRKRLFPVCLVLSCVALLLLILIHAWIPSLMEKEGKYQLFYATSLLLAYSVTLAVQILVPRGYATGDFCSALAFVMQFAFLSAFFWLNTMCFEIWKLFRNCVINMYGACSTLSTWKYLLWGLGGPLMITAVTIILQYMAPTDGSVPGLIHPMIGEGRCWFRSGKELLVYFYGPIAVLLLLNVIFLSCSYYHLKIIRGDYTSHTIIAEELTSKYDLFCVFWQRFYLLAMVTTCWLFEIISWLIPPEELWAVTDILNNLQGVFVFVLFLLHPNKRALLKEKLPKLFKCCSICLNHTKEAQTSINKSTKKLSEKISSASNLSNVTSYSSFSNSSICKN